MPLAPETIKVKVNGLGSDKRWTFSVRSIVNNVDKTVTRYYSDFLSLFHELTKEYPYCIVPPIPPRELKKPSSADDPLLIHRKHALRQFLVRAAAHKVLQDSKALFDFVRNDVWDKTVEEGIWSKFTSFLPSTGAGLVEADVAKNAYGRVLREAPATCTKQDWKEAQAYVGRLHEIYAKLAGEIREFVSGRRHTSKVLLDCAKGFEELAKSEVNFDKGDEGAALGRIMVTFAKTCKESISHEYDAQAETETILTVAAFEFYERYCTSAQDSISRLCNAMSEEEKLMQEMENAQDPQDSRHGQLYLLQSRKKEKREEVAKFAEALQEELRSFHQTMQYDLVRELRSWSEAQVNCSKNVEQSLKDVVEELKMKKSDN